MDPLESILGYSFRDAALLTEALTHASLAYEQQRQTKDNQRLEFLGDAVLQLVLSESLFHRLPDGDEGRLTKLRASLVSTKALSRLARSLELGRFLHMGRGEEASGGRDRESSLADVLEALIGAAYLDGGLPAASTLIHHIMGPLLQEMITAPPEEEHTNPKGLLQEMTQNVTNVLPIYQIMAATGPDHDRLYEVVVSWNGKTLGNGAGRSKKEAEVQAARAAIRNPLLEDLVRQTKLSPSASQPAVNSGQQTG